MKQLFKNILITIYVLSLMACNNIKIDYYAQKGVITILDKKTIEPNGPTTKQQYALFLYNGTEAQWYTTNEATYSQYEKGDTLPTLVLKITEIKTQ